MSEFFLDFGDLSLYLEDIKKFTHADKIRLEEVLWDTLARDSGMGECARCLVCISLFSKEQLFSRYIGTAQIKEYTPKELFSMYNEAYSCKNCQNKLTLIQPTRLDTCITESLTTTIVTCRNRNRKIIGGLLTYTTDFDTAYEREFRAHYDSSDREAIRISLIRTF
jgi:hypothetical protein